MDLTPYVVNLRHDLAVLAEAAGGEDVRALAERLTAALEPAVRLALLDALSAAADEITRGLAPGSVELRLRGREPGFVVTPPPDDTPVAEEPGRPPVPGSDDGTPARINFRLPEHLKLLIEATAVSEGLSVNAWLLRTAAAAVEPDQGRRTSRGQQRYAGWVR
jgi:hypothetical protein